MRTEYSIKNSITSFISNILSFIFIFISQTIFIKILGVEYNGLNGLFSNILVFLSLFELGIGTAIVYNLYKYINKDKKEKIKSLMLYYKKAYYIIALIISVVGLLLTPFIKYMIKEINIDINIYIVYFLFLISTVATYILSYRRNLLFAYQRKYILNIIHLIYIVVLNIVQIIILILTKNYYLYLIIKIICVLFENIYIHIKAGKYYPYLLDKNVKELDTNTKKDINKKVRALFIHKLSSVITNGTDNILISIFFGLKEVGIYTNYNYIISRIDILFRDIIVSTTASVGNLLVSNNYEKKYNVYKKIRFLNFWIATFTSTCLLVLLNPFIKIWLGNDFILDMCVVVVLVINYYQNIMQNTYSVFKNASGIWVEDKYVPVIKSLINLGSSIILLKIFGLAGVFLGTICSTLVLWFYSYPKFVYKRLFKKEYKNYYYQLFKSCILLFIITTITYYACNILVFSNLLIDLIIKIIICIFVSNIILIIVYLKDDNYKYYKDLIKTKILKRR